MTKNDIPPLAPKVPGVVPQAMATNGPKAKESLLPKIEMSPGEIEWENGRMTNPLSEVQNMVRNAVHRTFRTLPK